MLVPAAPQIQANLANLVRIYRLEGSHVSVDVATAELDEILRGQEDARVALQQWFLNAIYAYDNGFEIPQCPIDQADMVPEDELPEPKMYEPLKTALDSVKVGDCSMSSRQTRSPSPPLTGTSRAAACQPPGASSKALPTHATKLPPKLPVDSEHDPSEGEEESQELDDDGETEDTFDANAHNPAMTIDPATKIRRGTERHQPIMADNSFRFWAERVTPPEPSAVGYVWPRTITNYEFVDDQGEMTSIALGAPIEPLYLTGIAGSIVGDFEPSHRLMAGYWEFDKTSRERSPTEVLWVKARITKITSEKPECFRSGRTLVLCARGEDAMYILQSASVRYENRLQCSTIKPKTFSDVKVYPSSKKPAFMDDITWQRLQEDIPRFKQAGLNLTAPKPPVMTSALRKQLEAEGRLVEANWRLAVVDKQVDTLEQEFRRTRGKETSFTLDEARAEQAKLSCSAIRAGLALCRVGRTREPSFDDQESRYDEPVAGSPRKRRRTDSGSSMPGVGEAAENVSVDVNLTPPSSPGLTPAPSEVDAMGEPDPTFAPAHSSDPPGGDQGAGSTDIDVA
ncbi:hypothetical protein FRC08_002050 [Ceratobasidium sp. 394]|nr:hypothetical protein FRC08_002050 [Ceratobasidium sp. 394]KAG9101273.1 hypothetical protein FS749_008497 [Ceratobasidium sp. UAMH 11750]